MSNFDTTATVSTDPNPVSVHVAFDPKAGVLTWTFTSIDPVTKQLVEDPLAGFLPPDNAMQQGEGAVTFTVLPKAGLADSNNPERGIDRVRHQRRRLSLHPSSIRSSAQRRRPA